VTDPVGTVGPASIDLDHPHATDGVAQELGMLLRRARTVSETLARDVHPGLDASAFTILHLIGTGEATSVTDLATRLSVGKPTISRQVTGLEQLDLVLRRPAEQDRRAAVLVLTAEGCTRLADATQARNAWFRQLLADWPVSDVRVLGELLGRLNQLA
jgi:DNA-binding MarR family transcriptional regulator